MPDRASKSRQLYLWAGGAAAALVAVLGVEVMINSAPKQGPAQPADQRTIKELMDTMVDPNGDIVFESFRVISDDQGTREESPQSDADWEQVRHALGELAKASPLLQQPGRRAAPEGSHSLSPLVENEPEAVDRLIAADRKGFNDRAARFGDAVAKAQKAVGARDRGAYKTSLDGIAKACEACHLEFFYPNDKRAQDAAREDGI